MLIYITITEQETAAFAAWYGDITCGVGTNKECPTAGIELYLGCEATATYKLETDQAGNRVIAAVTAVTGVSLDGQQAAVGTTS